MLYQETGGETVPHDPVSQPRGAADVVAGMQATSTPLARAAPRATEADATSHADNRRLACARPR